MDSLPFESPGKPIHHILVWYILKYTIPVYDEWASLVTQMVKNPSAMQKIRVQSLCQEDPLQKVMATHSSILAWEIPRTEELGGLQSKGSQESDMT